MFEIIDGRKAFYQWDIGQRLYVDVDCSEVHYNSDSDNALVVKSYDYEGKQVVDVPNILLQTVTPITAYAVVVSDGVYTKYQKTFSVIARQKPDDYVYTETEVLSYSNLDERIRKLEATSGGGDAANGLPAGGEAGQILCKASDNDYDAQWTDINLPETEVAASDEYFLINDGVASLRLEYRGACPAEYREDFPCAVSNAGVGRSGSMNNRLPQDIVIPDEINGEKVVSLAPGMFLYNERINSVKIPDCVTEIPTRFCDNARNVQYITGTENVTSIGEYAFHTSGLKRAYFPELVDGGLGISAFSYCPYMIEVDVGNNITEIPNQAFRNNVSLVRVLGGENVNSVGERAFSQAVSLEAPSFVGNLTHIGERGFSRAGFDYDWGSLTSCEFGEYATSEQVHGSNKFWENVEYTPCENKVVSCFCQADPQWKDIQIGTSDRNFDRGCLIMTCLAAYSSITGEVFNTPMEYVDKIAAVDKELVAKRPSSYPVQREWLNAIGFQLEGNYQYTAENLKKFYAALARGDMIATSCVIDNALTGHSILINGVTNDGKVMCVNSGSFDDTLTRFDVYEAIRYSIPIQNLVSPQNTFCIVRRTTQEEYAEFLDIDTSSGIVYLKEAYRGACPNTNTAETPLAKSDNGWGVAGSKNKTLPAVFVIPDKVRGVAVKGFAPGIFRGNKRIVSIEIPKTITEIPLRFCDNALNVKEVIGTDNVTRLGKCAFQTTGLRFAYFPKLEYVDQATFSNSLYLTTANIGKTVKSLPRRMFYCCQDLSSVECSEEVESVGEETFLGTYSLKELPFLKKTNSLSSIGPRAFRNTGIAYEWGSLSCTLGEHATPPQLQSDAAKDFWVGVTPTQCEVPVASKFNSNNPKWANKVVGSTTTKYSVSTLTCCCAMAYSALSGEESASPAVYARLITTDPNDIETHREVLSLYGYTISERMDFNKTNLKYLYDKLATRKCIAIAEIMTFASALASHKVLVYGINEQGELMFIAPSSNKSKYEDYSTDDYSAPVQNIVQTINNTDGVSNGFYIITEE